VEVARRAIRTRIGSTPADLQKAMFKNCMPRLRRARVRQQTHHEILFVFA